MNSAQQAPGSVRCRRHNSFKLVMKTNKMSKSRAEHRVDASSTWQTALPPSSGERIQQERERRAETRNVPSSSDPQGCLAIQMMTRRKLSWSAFARKTNIQCLKMDEWTLLRRSRTSRLMWTLFGISVDDRWHRFQSSPLVKAEVVQSNPWNYSSRSVREQWVWQSDFTFKAIGKLLTFTSWHQIANMWVSCSLARIGKKYRWSMPSLSAAEMISDLTIQRYTFKMNKLNMYHIHARIHFQIIWWHAFVACKH